MMRKDTAMLTVKEAASQIGAAESSVRLWVRQGKFPGAKLEKTPVGTYWLIPNSALDSFEMGSPGRPPKPKKERKSPTRKKGASK